MGNFDTVCIIIIIKCIYKAHFRGCHKCARYVQCIANGAWFIAVSERLWCPL